MSNIATHVEYIKKDVTEIKVAMKEHNASDEAEFNKLNSKIDQVAADTRTAAEIAYQAKQKLNEQQHIVTERHEENKKALQVIDEKIDKISVKQDEAAKDLTNTKLKMYIAAAFIGLGSGGASPWIPKLIDLIT